MRREGKGGKVTKKGGRTGVPCACRGDAETAAPTNMWEITVNVDKSGEPAQILLHKIEDESSQIFLYRAGEGAVAVLQERIAQKPSPCVDENAPFRAVRKVRMEKAPDLAEVMWDMIAIFSKEKFQSVHEVMISMDGGNA